MLIMTRRRKYDLDKACEMVFYNCTWKEFLDWGTAQGMSKGYADKMYKQLKKTFSMAKPFKAVIDTSSDVQNDFITRE